jgi:hypothetical protein
MVTGRSGALVLFLAAAVMAACASDARPPAIGAAVTKAARSNASCSRWRVVKSPDGGSANSTLYSGDFDGANDGWAVGSYQHGAFRTLAERWNGSSWKIVATKNLGSGDNNLVGVVALSASSAWAVGDWNPTQMSTPRTLVEHWNGKKWSVVASPSLGQLSGLSDVAASGPNDIWSVGAYFNRAGNQQTLIERWDGSAWKIVSSPSPGASYNALSHLAIVSANDIWAVGYYSSDSGGTSQTLVERWNGHTWSVVPSPNAPNSVYDSLGGVVAVDADDIWAVGASEGAPSYATRTLIERWNGSSWSIVQSPNVGTKGNSLFDIASVSAKSVWSAGYYVDQSDALDRTLIERWNGKAWRVVKSGNPGRDYDQLHAIWSIGQALWSAGNEQTGSDGDPLVESYCS